MYIRFHFGLYLNCLARHRLCPFLLGIFRKNSQSGIYFNICFDNSGHHLLIEYIKLKDQNRKSKFKILKEPCSRRFLLGAENPIVNFNFLSLVPTCGRRVFQKMGTRKLCGAIIVLHRGKMSSKAKKGFMPGVPTNPDFDTFPFAWEGAPSSGHSRKANNGRFFFRSLYQNRRTYKRIPAR